ncbi:hypothetical protein HK405_013715 [Cladochytrium tenue]|nr:hypothetical protein HK405_013715 [Cladochytrium tenue]
MHDVVILSSSPRSEYKYDTAARFIYAIAYIRSNLLRATQPSHNMAPPPPAGSVTSDAGGDLGAAVESLKKVSLSPTQSVREPLQPTGALEHLKRVDLTRHIGTEFERGVQLSELLHGSNSDAVLRDLAILVSRRGVVFFRNQDLNIADHKELLTRLGELAGKPATSKLHVHPIISNTPLGDEISVITSDGRSDYDHIRRSKLASNGWHSDITFENVPSDYAALKVHTPPEGAGGDTLWASGYELYDRLSPAFRKFLEGLTATHGATHFKTIAKLRGLEIPVSRGAPENADDSLEAVHPVIRTNPVTGWKSVFVNKVFTKHINELGPDESDVILELLNRFSIENHDLQVRFRWEKNDVAIWDNRSTFHTATNDYLAERRVGDRVVSLGERPYFDSASRSRREDLGITGGYEDGRTPASRPVIARDSR